MSDESELLLEKLIAALAEWGLNLVHVFDLSELPDSMRADLKALQPDLNKFQQLVLIAHGGKDLWQRFKAEQVQGDEPLDQMCVNAWKSVVEKEPLRNPNYQILYPTAEPLASTGVSLPALGALAGWHHTSPLGIGIHPQFGLWSAYRLLILTDTNLANVSNLQNDNLNAGTEAQSPCDACASKPCLAACPAGAVNATAFKVSDCIDHRMSPGSACQQQCLSRIACPVAREHRYTKEQINYHYASSLQMVKMLRQDEEQTSD